jgi:hypothetical protein
VPGVAVPFRVCASTATFTGVFEFDPFLQICDKQFIHRAVPWLTQHSAESTKMLSYSGSLPREEV